MIARELFDKIDGKRTSQGVMSIVTAAVPDCPLPYPHLPSNLLLLTNSYTLSGAHQIYVSLTDVTVGVYVIETKKQWIQ